MRGCGRNLRRSRRDARVGEAHLHLLQQRVSMNPLSNNTPHVRVHGQEREVVRGGAGVRLLRSIELILTRRVCKKTL